MPNEEPKKCPRCQSDFECKVEGILDCQCSNVLLSDAEREYVSARYDDCLCINCLTELLAEFNIVNFKRKEQPTLQH